MRTYFLVRDEWGQKWDAALPLREQAQWDQHAAFMDALTAEGFIVLGGVLDNAQGALLVIDAEDEATVRARLADDPWQKSGHLRIGSIEPWKILLDGRRPETFTR